jgi:hypothetical protein
MLPLGAAQGVTLTRRDNYRFAVLGARPCHLYAFQRDTRPSVTVLFPNPRYSPLGNPLPPGRLAWLPDRPGERAWFGLDAAVGEERVAFVAVTRPLRDPAALGRRLVEAPERVGQDLARDLAAYVEPGDPPGAPCFADGAMQAFGFLHR